MKVTGEAGPAIETFRTLYGYGAGPDQVMLDLLDHCHGASVAKAIGPQALVMPKEQAARLAAVGSAVSAGMNQSAMLADLVRFAGWCERTQVDELLAQADVLVLPSHDEVLPLVVLEALAHGVAVLCTPVGELPSVLCEGTHACFVPVGDVQALAGALHRLLDDAGLRETLARNGRALYERQFALGPFFDRVAHIHQRHFGVAGRRRDASAAQGDPR